MNSVTNPTCLSSPKLLLLSKSTLHTFTLSTTTSYYKPPISNVSTTNKLPLNYLKTKHNQQHHLSYVASLPQFISCSSNNKINTMIHTNYIAVTLFTGLLGFLFLSILGPPRRRRDSSFVATRNDPTQGDHPRDNGFGADVIIVGAGVAGSALAHTLAKVPMILSIPLFFQNDSLNH